MAHQIIEEYIEINGIKEYTYQAIEEGLPIALFVHGSGTPDSLFAYCQIKDFEGLCSCIFYDQRGSGKTYKKNKTSLPSFADMQKDLYETILYFTKKYHTDQVILVANSLGTVISTPIIHEHPELISKFIASGFIHCMRDCEQSARQTADKLATDKKDSSLIQKLQKLGDYPTQTFDGKMTNRFRKIESQCGLSKPVTKEMKQLMMKSPIFTYSDLFTMLKSPKINDTLFHEIWNYDALSIGKSFEVPFYFLHGEDDIIAPLSCAKEYLDAITAPKKELIPIKKAGHITGFDNTTDYCAAFHKCVLDSIS